MELAFVMDLDLPALFEAQQLHTQFAGVQLQRLKS